ncbi:MAG: sodium:calcium antiporter [Acidobacteria bacterium]|nr:sodium:calcium antiporter [Acidobacteriota bacterium]
MNTAILSVVAGLVLLILASDRLVVAAVRLSETLGVSAVLVGALVVGLGTSLPELLVSGLLARDGKLDEAVTNVISSNTANVTLVLGLAALVATIHSSRRILYREGILMIASVVAFAAVLLDKKVEVWEGAALLVGLVVAIYALIVWSLHGPDVADNAPGVGAHSPRGKEPFADLPTTRHEMVAGVIAIVVTVGAARLLLSGAETIATELGASATLIGTMLGVGTSLPEMATAVSAARRKQVDLIIGNVLGSNIFNSLAVGGVAALIGPGLLVEVDTPLLVVMVVTAVIAGVLARTGGKIVRLEGVALIAVFGGFAALVL